MCSPKIHKQTTNNKLTITDMVEMYLNDLLSITYSDWFHKILLYMVNCGTGSLGFTTYQCTECKNITNHPNACNNRHCPKCGAKKRAEWAEKLSQNLLPTEHFHLVFTLPHELNSCIRKNSEAVLNIFFQSIAETLTQFAKNKALDPDVKIAFMMVLHTWTQTLDLHYHVHILFANGYYSKGKWVSFGTKFLFSIKALSKVFKAKFLEKLETLVKNEQIKEAKTLTAKTFIQSLSLPKKWNVYAAAPYNGELTALKYFARYANRVAISDSRISSATETEVIISCRKDKCERDPRPQRVKTITLPTIDFLKKFMLHFLPKGFRKIRYFGFYAGSASKEIKEQVVELLNNKNKIKLSNFKPILLKIRNMSCSICKGTLQIIKVHRITLNEALRTQSKLLDTG